MGDLPTQVQVPWTGRLGKALKAEPPRWLQYAAVALWACVYVISSKYGERMLCGKEEKERRIGDSESEMRDGPRDVDEENREPRAEAVGY